MGLLWFGRVVRDEATEIVNPAERAEYSHTSAMVRPHACVFWVVCTYQPDWSSSSSSSSVPISESKGLSCLHAATAAALDSIALNELVRSTEGRRRRRKSIFFRPSVRLSVCLFVCLAVLGSPKKKAFFLHCLIDCVALLPRRSFHLLL